MKRTYMLMCWDEGGGWRRVVLTFDAVENESKMEMQMCYYTEDTVQMESILLRFVNNAQCSMMCAVHP